HIGGRLDLTPGNSFTLSRATRQLLRTLPDLVTLKLFASAALPPEVAFLKRDVDDLLNDYRAAGRGKVKLVIADPASDSAAMKEARTLGIPPVQFNVLGQAELQVKEGYLGLAIRHADGVKTIPFVQQSNDLEYRLTSDIRALTHPEKTVIAFGEISDAAPARRQRSSEALRAKASPVNADLEAVLLPWTSQIDTPPVTAGTVTPLLVTSRAGGVQETMAFLDPSRAFSRDSLRRRVVALLASAPGPDTTKGAPRGRLVVVGSGDFASDRYTRNSPENLVFVENAIDWLAQDD